MQTYRANDWGGDTLQACRDIVQARNAGADIIIHEGKFAASRENHLSTISRACADSGIEVVLHGVPDPDIVYPHITFVEES